MGLLNKQVYTMERDKLIYDATHPIDAGVVQVSITPEEEGVIERGTVIDCTNGIYKVHEAGGEVSVIVAEDTDYAADDTEIVVQVYISGTFRASEVKTDEELTEADLETFRSKGIYLK